MTDYAFSDTEIQALLRVLRAHGCESVTELNGIMCFLEKSIYEIMTIEEAEIYFNEK